MKSIIYENGNYMIVEMLDSDYNLNDLMGDCYNPECNPDIDPKILEKQKNDFVKKVEQEFVFGYVIKMWNPDIGVGWITIDSCWGFVGDHIRHNHYIIDEYKSRILKGEV